MRIGNYLPGQQPNKRQDGINRALAKRIDRVLQGENGSTGAGGTVIYHRTGAGGGSGNSGGTSGGNVNNSYVTQTEVYHILNQYFNQEVIAGEGLLGLQGPPGPPGSSTGTFGLMHSETTFITMVTSYDLPPMVMKDFTDAVECGVNCAKESGQFTVRQCGYYRLSLKALLAGDSGAMSTGYTYYINGENPASLYGFTEKVDLLNSPTTIKSIIIPVLLAENDTVELRAGIHAGSEQIVIWHRPILSLEYIGCPI